MSETNEPTRRYPLASDPVVPTSRQTAPKQDFGTSLANAVRDNPASAALIGMGAAWLFFGGSRTSLFGRTDSHVEAPSSRRWRDHDDDMRFEAAQARYVDRFGGPTRPSDGFIKNAASAVGDAGHRAGESLSGGASAFAGAASQSYDTAGSYVSDAASSLGTSAYDTSRAGSRMIRSQAGHVQQTVGEFFEEQPLALGVFGLALGAGVAALLPSTDIEREYLGETADAVKEQARALTGKKIGEAKQMADAALDEVAREAKAQGLAPSDLKDAATDLQDRAAHVASAAGASIRNEAGKVP